MLLGVPPCVDFAAWGSTLCGLCRLGFHLVWIVSLGVPPCVDYAAWGSTLCGLCRLGFQLVWSMLLWVPASLGMISEASLSEQEAGAPARREGEAIKTGTTNTAHIGQGSGGHERE
jgi:hypothetical protein